MKAFFIQLLILAACLTIWSRHGLAQSTANHFDSMFERIERMHQNFNDDFIRSPMMSDYPFHSSSFSARSIEINHREDDEYKYVDINKSNVTDNRDITVDVEGGMITIRSATSSSKENSDEGYNFQSKSFSSFSQSIPVPSGVDSEKVEFLNDGDTLSLKFRKKK